VGKTRTVVAGVKKTVWTRTDVAIVIAVVMMVLVMYITSKRRRYSVGDLTRGEGRDLPDGGGIPLYF
jgi:hypothetical protein